MIKVVIPGPLLASHVEARDPQTQPEAQKNDGLEAGVGGFPGTMAQVNLQPNISQSPAALTDC